MLCAAAHGQTGARTIQVTGDRLSGFVLPIEPIAADAHLQALRAWAWTVDDTKRLLLQGDVAITIGAHSFTANEAVVWINRIPSADGLINQFAMYFDQVSDSAAQAGVGAGGRRVLLTASTRGAVALSVSLLNEHEPRQRALVDDGERRLADYLRRLLADSPRMHRGPRVTPLDEPVSDFIPVPGGSVAEAAEPDDLPERVHLPPLERSSPWLVGPSGLVTFSAQQVEMTRGDVENVITAIGAIVVEILPDRADPTGGLTIAAERAVIFTDPGPLADAAQQLESENVRGIYLEGNVSITTHPGGEGEYAVRAPRVYYDFRTQQAIMVDSLLRVQPRDIPLPVYARAEEMRQLAEDQWEARRITVSTSEFHDPHLAIGARRAVVTRRPSVPGSGSRTTVHVDSHDNTVRMLDVPIFYWPRFKGDIERIPIRNVQVGSRRNDGVRILTTWDLFALTGLDAPDGVDADLKIDGFTDRGAAIGTEWRYDLGDAEGRVDLYGLYDTGIDRTSAGRNVDPDRDIRGYGLWEQQWRLNQHWTMQTQLSYISDETFISAWREDEFAERREFETSNYLKYQRDNHALTLLGKLAINDFISNSYLLASRQYTVDRLPELTYRRYGDSLFGDSITYSTENRVSRMRMVFVDDTPAELGVPGVAFGVGGNTLLSDALFAQGLNEQWVLRFDSRHELSMPLKTGIFNVTPFVVGRFTAYDDDFEDFSSDADSMRVYGAAGVRANTMFQRIDNSVESRLFDLHRLRHIVEPYVTAWAAHSSVTQQHLPIYDERVESLADGAAVQVGVRNTWQTQRGGPGRWRSVDWLMIDTSIVIDSEGEPNESPTPQFFEYRPEYSQQGDHVRAFGAWLLSDSLTLAGDLTYALEDSLIARSSIGVELRHSPVFVTFIEYRYIQANQSELLDVGWRYQLTPKYHVALSPQWDFREEQFRAVTGRLTRRFPDFDLIFIVRYDAIRDDTLFGASLGLTRF